MRVLISIDDNNGVYAKLSKHFGRCPYFAIYDTDNEKLEIKKNTIDHNNLDLSPIDQIMPLRPDIICTLGIGTKARFLLEKKNIMIKTGEYETLGEVIANVNQLKDLTSSCKH